MHAHHSASTGDFSASRFVRGAIDGGRVSLDAPLEVDHVPPAADLGLFSDKRLVVLGGYGETSRSGGQQHQWRSMWDAFRQYGDGSPPPKEEIERSRGCKYC